jgi:hypothetical protein
MDAARFGPSGSSRGGAAVKPLLGSFRCLLGPLVFVTAHVLAGCGSDDPAGTGGGSGSTAEAGTGGAGPRTYRTSPCGECVHEACAAAFDACSADPECPAYAECLDACPLDERGNADPSCDAACPRGTGSESRRAVAAIGACRDPGVGADCAACNVGQRPVDPPFPEVDQTCTEPSMETEECFICQDDNCCETQDLCNANAECVAMRECITAGGRVETCGIAHRAGADDFAKGSTCQLYRCSNLCGGAGESCYDCMFENCGLEWATLNRTGAGLLHQFCVGTCPGGDDACDEVCYDAYPEALADYIALGACVVATGCPSVCVKES